MKLEFDSIEEVKDFVTKLKGTRGGKGQSDTDDGASAATGGQAAPQPLAPPAGGPGAGFPGAGGFAPPAGGAAAGVFPAAGAGPAPEVLALVQRISTRIDGAIASGQPADQVLTWFRGQCGAEAANFTMDQIKTIALPKAGMPVLENIAKLMNA